MLEPSDRKFEVDILNVQNTKRSVQFEALASIGKSYNNASNDFHDLKHESK